MTINHLKDEIINLLAECLGVNPNLVGLESDFKKDLDADSIDMVEVIMSIENKYGVTVSDDDASTIRTVGDVVQFVHSKLSKN